MLEPRLRCLLSSAIFLCVSHHIVYPSANIFTQIRISSTPDTTGIELYEKGDNVAAIKALKATVKHNRADLTAWYYLGLAFDRQGKTSDARKAHEKAAKLGDALIDARFTPLGGGDFRALFQEIHEPLSQAAESAKRYIALNPKLSKSKLEDWIDREEYLRSFAGFSDTKNVDSSQYRILSGREVTTKARVTQKPEPQYTEKARQNQITGTVVLRAIFAADGKVVGIFPLRALPYGLTRSAIKAARRIKFIPATKDGQPVSMWMLLEYNFNLY